MASLMTPSPKTRLYSRGALSGRSTCSTATESVAAKITPSASESCRWEDTSHPAQLQLKPGQAELRPAKASCFSSTLQALSILLSHKEINLGPHVDP